MSNITFEEFKKIEVKIGRVTKVEKVEDADKLLRLEVDFGDFNRQIVSAIAEYYKPEDIIGRKLPFIINLEPRSFRGVESQGMLMAMDTDEKPVFLVPDEDVPEGTLVV